MSEEIRKNVEICEEKLEDVSGGTESATSITCPKCGGKMLGTTRASGVTDGIPKYICIACRYGEW